MVEQRIFTVSELTASIRGLLETSFPFISVSGEISNLRKPQSGHLYFTLKDAGAQIKVVLFKMQQRYLSRPPKDGEQVILRGRISVYEPRGDYQLIADTLDYQGEGNLQLAFEQLKKKLAEEGLFDAQYKKELPILPCHIILITSPRGAAVHDFIRIATHRFPLTRISIYPVAVQGDGATEEMIQALQLLNEFGEADILVLCRGGGSSEDLQCYNNENLARAIFSSELPVVSAVGHEIDFTISDLVADFRAPTPSGAAEKLLPDRYALLQHIQSMDGRIHAAIRQLLHSLDNRLDLQKDALGRMRHPLEKFMLRLDYTRARLEQNIVVSINSYQKKLQSLADRLSAASPKTKLSQQQYQITILHSRLLLAMEHLVQKKKENLGLLTGVLETVSPLATLARGYAIVKKRDGKQAKVITDSSALTQGERVNITLHRGSLDCLVEKTSTKR